jgi:acyl-CoA synthetase (AMP-forming)/AMP-acid ligase II
VNAPVGREPVNVTLPGAFRPMTMLAGVRAAMEREPAKTAIVFGDQSRTYAELVRRAEAATNAAINDLGLKPGMNVGIVSKNRIEYFEVVTGLPEAGAPVATINPRLTSHELEAACDDAQCRVLFVDPASAPAARAARFQTVKRIIEFGPDYEAWLALGAAPAIPPRVEEWDVWTIPYTSGTTGKPKGVLLSHRGRTLIAFGCQVEFGCFGPEDRFLAMTPLNHAGGLSFPIGTLLFGGTVVLMDGFDAEAVLRAFKFGGVTGVFMVPTHFHSIFALPADVLEACRAPPNLTIICNAAPLPQAMKEKIVPYFGEGALNEIYASTENGLVSNLRPPDQLRKTRCVGLPFCQTRLKVVSDDGRECAPGEVGEVFSFSPYIFNGYWNRPEETEAAFRDGWVSVGDLGRRDEDGFLYIVDRKKDMVISGGVNIYPREIEEVLFAHPAVAEVAVVGAPDERWGEKLKAFVVPAGDTRPTLEELITFCAGQLASYKLPKDLAYIDALPRNANGKVLKTVLRTL